MNASYDVKIDFTGLTRGVYIKIQPESDGCSPSDQKPSRKIRRWGADETTLTNYSQATVKLPASNISPLSFWRSYVSSPGSTLKTYTSSMLCSRAKTTFASQQSCHFV
jgi:hypothetical protein